MPSKKTAKPGKGEKLSADKDLTKVQRKRKAEILRKPVQQLNIEKGMTAGSLVDAMAGMSIQARNLGRCAKVLKGMMEDKGRPTVFLGLAASCSRGAAQGHRRPREEGLR